MRGTKALPVLSDRTLPRCGGAYDISHKSEVPYIISIIILHINEVYPKCMGCVYDIDHDPKDI